MIDLVLKDVNFYAYINLPDANCKILSEKTFFFFPSAHPVLKTKSLLEVEHLLLESNEISSDKPLC